MKNSDTQWNEEQKRGTYPHKIHHRELPPNTNQTIQSSVESEKNRASKTGVDGAKRSLFHRIFFKSSS